MKYQWFRFHSKGYEVSSFGDKRFSAFYAKMPDGRTIEEHYQVDIKGYSSVKEGKGRLPKNKSIDLYKCYLNLWVVWAAHNSDLMLELSKHKIITDKYANTPNNQARALCDILNGVV